MRLLQTLSKASATLSGFASTPAFASPTQAPGCYLFRKLLDATTDGIFILNHSGCIDHVNTTAAALLGYEIEELQGHNAVEFIPELNQDIFKRRLSALGTTNFTKVGPTHKNGILIHKNGSLIHIDLRITDISNSNQKSLLCQMRDITNLIDSEKSVGQLAAIAASTKDAIISQSLDGTILAWNRGAEELYGYTASEAIGAPSSMFIPLEHQEEDRKLVQEVINGKQIIHFETKRRNRTGTIYDVLMSIAPIRSSKGEILGIVKIVHDQRESIDAEKKNGLLGAIIESTTDVIVSVDMDCLITSWNPAAEHLYGYRADEVIGKSSDILVPKDRKNEIKKILSKICRGQKVIRAETTRVCKSGELIDVAITISPIYGSHGQVIGASKIEQDIRNRKDSERIIMRHLDALRQSNQELDDFAYIASHDLKEPLRGLINNVNFLKEDCANKFSPDDMRRMDRMDLLCHRMTQLIDDLLYFSRLGRQALALQETDFNTLIHEVQQTLETVIAERHVTIVIPTPLPTIYCDKPRMTEVFRNLITNAIKFNNKDSVLIEIGEQEPDDPVTRAFYVKDNGIGIDARFYDDVFKIFKRLNAEDDKTRGTGVGLTFVKKIIERHNGKVWITSKVGQGTTFHFSINTRAETQK